MGLSFHLRNMNSIAENINTAVQLMDKKFISEWSFPYNANNIIVTAAEMISPKEADFNPFSTSST